MAHIASFAVPTLLVVFPVLGWKASPDRHLKLRFTIFTLIAAHLAAGMIVPGLAGMVTNVLMPWITGRSLYGAIGPYFALSFVLIIGHALIRHRITDLRLVLHSGLTLAIATIVSSVPAVVLLLVFGPRLFGH